MPKAPNTKTSAKKNRNAAKIADLPAKTVKEERAAVVKGGLMEEEGIYYLNGGKGSRE
ncbi:MAG TPA: hypothetical protein VEU07_16370 [Candidatus Acidoferrum sp.]|nr:hypothetical protein [Candidatus Acidoferrum sp.]